MALALRNELGLHFTGPVKTATASFPIEIMRHTLAKMTRGDHIVLKCLDVPILWAVGWHDHHYKCYVTTHGVTTPGKPALKRGKICQRSSLGASPVPSCTSTVYTV
jgi:hypothetical protein